MVTICLIISVYLKLLMGNSFHLWHHLLNEVSFSSLGWHELRCIMTSVVVGVLCITIFMFHFVFINYMSRYTTHLFSSMKMKCNAQCCLLKPLVIICHFRWVPCHHGILCPQVADGSQIRRGAANILNKQPQAVNKEWPSSLGVGHGAEHSSPQKISFLWNVTDSLRLGPILSMNGLS
jgi:hypothetical protein